MYPAMSSDALTRPVYLARTREGSQQRAHFAIFIPNSVYRNAALDDYSQPCLGTLINVVGAPMTGFCHEFKRNYNIMASRGLQPLVYLGSIDSSIVTDPQTTAEAIDTTATGTLDGLALQILPPGVSQNFMAPVNDVSHIPTRLSVSIKTNSS